MMSEDSKVQKTPIEQMTIEQITDCMKENQRQITTLLDQLTLRASIQSYTEQQYDELLTLVQEALTYIEEVPVSLEWVERRNELIAKLNKKL